MMKTSTLIRLAAVGLAVTAIAACTPRRPADTGVPATTSRPPDNPVYPRCRHRQCRRRQPWRTPPPVRSRTSSSTSATASISTSTAMTSAPTPMPRLDAQAAWLQRYPQVTVRIEGNADERGTARIQSGPGCPPRRVDPHLSGPARHLRRSHRHHQLRQGAPDRRRLDRGQPSPATATATPPSSRARRADLTVTTNPGKASAPAGAFFVATR